MQAPPLEITSVVLAVYQEKSRLYRYRGERHPGLWEIFCLDRGRAFVRVGKRRFWASPGECLLYPAGVFHQHQGTRGSAPHYITVAFRVRGGKALEPLRWRNTPLPNELRSLLARVVAEGERPRDRLGQTLQRALLTEFIVGWLRLVKDPGAAAEPRAERETYQEHAAHQAVAKALSHLQEHFHEDVSLEDVARAACVSAPHLRHLVRRHLGYSLREALKRIRIDHARHLLSQEAGNVKTVARAVGYGNAASFARVFRAVTGQSPSAYARTIAARGPTPWQPLREP